jgi:hypothetical protein
MRRPVTTDTVRAVPISAMAMVAATGRAMSIWPTWPRTARHTVHTGPPDSVATASSINTTTAATQAPSTPPIAVNQAATPSCGLIPLVVILASTRGPNQLNSAAYSRSPAAMLTGWPGRR